MDCIARGVAKSQSQTRLCNCHSLPQRVLALLGYKNNSSISLKEMIQCHYFFQME